MSQAIDDNSMKVIIAILSGFLGYILSRLKAQLEKKEQQYLAAAAFRFELQSNLGWIDDIVDTKNYLRDEAWVKMKNEGYVSFLKSPIPQQVIDVYDQLHRLNEQIRILKDSKDEKNHEMAKNKVLFFKDHLRSRILKLINEMDKRYPKIGQNYK